MNVITASKSNNTITIMVNDNGTITSIPATSDHPKWDEIQKAWKENNYEMLYNLMNMQRVVERFSNGDLKVTDTGVFCKDVQLVGVDVNRIMAFLRAGDPYEPIANYMVRKLNNPSRRAINEMYSFLEHRQMPLTPSGTIISYKGVLKNFYSVSSGNEILVQGKRNESGQIFNGVGETIEMRRSDVDDDFRKGCSGGLHAGSLEYAKNWAKEHDGIIVVIEIDPADVVSVPEDCECSKLRACKYKVVGIYNGPLPDTYTDEFNTPEDIQNPEYYENDTENQCKGDCCNCNCDNEENPNECNGNYNFNSEDLNTDVEIEYNSLEDQEETTVLDPNSYEDGYKFGYQNGVRRRKRIFYEKYQSPHEFARGYNDGYRAGRKDYKH